MARRIGVDGGVIVGDVTPNSAAADAGLKPTRISDDEEIDLGDMIIAVDDTRVRSTEDLYDFLDKHHVGDQITITVIRNAGTREQRTLDLKTHLKRQSFNE